MSVLRLAVAAYERAVGPRTVLVVARQALDEQLDMALQTGASRSALPWLAWAPLVLQPAREGLHALAGELRAGAPPRLPVSATGRTNDARTAPSAGRPPAGLLLLYVAEDEWPPSDPVEPWTYPDSTDTTGAWSTAPAMERR